METPAPYIVNGKPVKARVECFRLRPKRVRYRFTRRSDACDERGVKAAKASVDACDSAGQWHATAMPATVTPTRKTAAHKFRDLPPAERKKRLTAFLDDVSEFWKGRPSTGSVDFLLKLRRGE